MNAALIIKSGDDPSDHTVRRVDVVVGPQNAQPDGMVVVERRLAEAIAEIAVLEEQIGGLGTAADEAWRDGHHAGVQEGKRQAEIQADALLDAVASAATTASTAFVAQLATLQEATGHLAGLALSRIVGEVSESAGLIEATVRRAVAETFGGSVVAVEVSAADFADLERLKAEVPQNVVVRIGDDLASGGCRLRLEIGEVDLDLGTQTERLRNVLEGLV